MNSTHKLGIVRNFDNQPDKILSGYWHRRVEGYQITRTYSKNIAFF
jgi:hypothetical protein